MTEDLGKVRYRKDAMRRVIMQDRRPPQGYTVTISREDGAWAFSCGYGPDGWYFR